MVILLVARNLIVETTTVVVVFLFVFWLQPILQAANDRMPLMSVMHLGESSGSCPGQITMRGHSYDLY